MDQRDDFRPRNLAHEEQVDWLKVAVLKHDCDADLGAFALRLYSK